jgi:hypothetical protein
MTDRDTFLQYGHSFQVKVLTLLITDQEYLATVFDILKKEYFDSDAAQWLVKDIMDYFYEYKVCPSWEVMAIRMKDGIKNQTLGASAVALMKEAYDYRNHSDLEFVKNTSLEFCQNQEIKLAFEDGIGLLQRGEKETLRLRFDRAFKAGVKKDLGHVWKEGLDFRMSENARICISTPWDVVNDICDGGSASGDLFVMVAPPGIGKTWGLVAVGAHAVKLGKNVIHYTMELQEPYVGKRYDANLSGISAQNLKYHKDEIQSAIAGVEGGLLIKYYPPKTASVQTLRAHIESCILQGFKPDLVIVDYGDLVKPIGGFKEVRHQLENIYEDLRTLAGEFHLPVWTASQANRSSMEEDIIGGEKISEAFSKLMVADFVISLSRKVQDKVGGTGRWHVIKNRFGPDGMTFPSKMNTSTGLIQLFEESTPQGRETKKDMDKGQLAMRKILRRKKEEMDDKPSLDMRDDNDENKLGGFEGDDAEPTVPVEV